MKTENKNLNKFVQEKGPQIWNKIEGPVKNVGKNHYVVQSGYKNIRKRKYRC